MLNSQDAWYEVLSDVAKKIRDYRLPVQTVSIDDYETVAEIFNRVNTGGRPLSKGDLIMGVVAARWPGRPARDGEAAIKGVGSTSRISRKRYERRTGRSIAKYFFES